LQCAEKAFNERAPRILLKMMTRRREEELEGGGRGERERERVRAREREGERERERERERVCVSESLSARKLRPDCSWRSAVVGAGQSPFDLRPRDQIRLKVSPPSSSNMLA